MSKYERAKGIRKIVAKDAIICSKIKNQMDSKVKA